MDKNIPKNEDIEHSIKSPLCSIKMAVALLDQEHSENLTENQRKLIDILVTETKRLSNNLLEHKILSKSETNTS